MTRTILASATLAMLIAACGASTTADEYVEDLNALAATGRSDFEAAAVVYDEVAELRPLGGCEGKIGCSTVDIESVNSVAKRR